MELMSKEIYHGGFGTLLVGEVTTGRDIPEHVKRQMLLDHPDWFEIVEETNNEVIIQTPEDKLVVETPEAKMTSKVKTRTK